VGPSLERHRCLVSRILDGIRQAGAQVLNAAEGQVGFCLQRRRHVDPVIDRDIAHLP
jgi:hypothetical protein